MPVHERRMKPAAMWAYRRLRGRLDRYTDVRDEPGLRDQHPTIRELVGMYHNPEDGPPSFLISESGLNVPSEPVAHLPYAGFTTVEFDHDKTQARALDLVSRDGTRTRLGVAGGDGRFRDSYMIGTFMNRLIVGLGNGSGKRD